MRIDDPYKILGVSRDATEEEIKKAYRKCVKRYHPDLHPDDPIAYEMIEKVNVAYDMITQPEKFLQPRTKGQYRSSQQRNQQYWEQRKRAEYEQSNEADCKQQAEFEEEIQTEENGNKGCFSIVMFLLLSPYLVIPCLLAVFFWICGFYTAFLFTVGVIILLIWIFVRA